MLAVVYIVELVLELSFEFERIMCIERPLPLRPCSALIVRAVDRIVVLFSSNIIILLYYILN